MICLHLKIPENTMRLILGQILVLHMPMVSMAKIQSFAQFPVDHLSHPVVSSFVLLLWLFDVFAYNVINHSIIIIILLFESFSHQRLLMVFHWSLSDKKSSQVTRTLLSILADLNNAVVISKSSSPCTNPLVTVPSTLITIGVIVIFMFHSF